MGDEEYRWCIRPVGAELLMQAARTASCLEAAGRSRSSPLVSVKRASSACESCALVRLMGTQLSHHAQVLQHLVSKLCRLAAQQPLDTKPVPVGVAWQPSGMHRH